MTVAPRPDGEAERLQALQALQLPGLSADPVLDGLVRCAAQALAYPAAMVSLVYDTHQCFIARIGMAERETPRDHAFCAHTVLGDALLEVPDALADPRFADSPLVRGTPNIRAYAGMPICVDGQRIGSLCVIDQVPRRLDADQRLLLADLARAVAAWFTSRRTHLDLVAESARSQQRLDTLQTLAEQVPGMVFQYREVPGGSHFTFVSPQAETQFELTPDALRDDVGRLFARIHPEDRAGVHEALGSAVADGRAWQQVFRVQLPRQGLRWRSASAMPSRQADGSVLWNGVIADLSDQVEMSTLRQDKRVAERATQAKSAFLSRVSHELRTPLNAILGFTQLLLVDAAEPLGTRQTERAEQVHKAARLLLGHINDMLDLGRIEQDVQALELAPVDLRQLLGGCLPMMAMMAGQAGVHFEVSVPGEVPVVRADSRRLEQVLLNLLSNGIKYNRRGGRLRIGLHAEQGSGRVEVQDDGQGLSPAQMARLFQPFNRLGAEHTAIEGSGLGLVIARQLAEAMGGRLEVRSVPAVGSTFILSLPLQPREPGATAGTPVERVPLAAQRAHG